MFNIHFHNHQKHIFKIILKNCTIWYEEIQCFHYDVYPDLIRGVSDQFCMCTCISIQRETKRQSNLPNILDFSVQMDLLSAEWGDGMKWQFYLYFKFSVWLLRDSVRQNQYHFKNVFLKKREKLPEKETLTTLIFIETMHV